MCRVRSWVATHISSRWGMSTPPLGTCTVITFGSRPRCLRSPKARIVFYLELGGRPADGTAYPSMGRVAAEARMPEHLYKVRRQSPRGTQDDQVKVGLKYGGRASGNQGNSIRTHDVEWDRPHVGCEEDRMRDRSKR